VIRPPIGQRGRGSHDQDRHPLGLELGDPLAFELRVEPDQTGDHGHRLAMGFLAKRGDLGIDDLPGEHLPEIAVTLHELEHRVHAAREPRAARRAGRGGLGEVT
jgi:hypothetical protein